jgi:hypothetical protein
VAVNHIWLRHFGQALVPTVFDFGKNGRPPTHPQLLDWLAAELIQPTAGAAAGSAAAGSASAGAAAGSADGPSAASPSGGWSMKHLHRLIVLSATYRQASTLGPAAGDDLVASSNASAQGPGAPLPIASEPSASGPTVSEPSPSEPSTT